MKKKYLREIFPVILIFSVILVVFYQALFNQFKADDFAWLYVAEISKDNIFNSFTLDLGGFFRPFNHLLFLGWYSFFGLNPLGYHSVNILLFHFVNSILVYYLVKKLANKQAALITSLIFATSAVHFDSILFQSGGMVDNGLSTFFTLFSFISFIKWQETAKRKYLFASFLVFVFNLLSFESSVILPTLLFAYLVIFSGRFNVESLLIHVKKLILYIIPLIPYLIFQYIIQKSGLVVNLGIYYFGFHFLQNIWDYFVSMFIVFPTIDIIDIARLGALKILYPIVQNTILITYVIVLLASGFIFIKGSKHYKFFLLWFAIAILPFSFFVPPEQSRFTYAASIGTSALLAMFLCYIHEKSFSYLGATKSNLILMGLVSLVVIGNSVVMILIENYKFNNGVSDESVMINFMKSEHPTFPEGSKIYFVTDSMPFRDLILHMVMRLYYPSGVVEPHSITTYENGVNSTYTIYYPVSYEIFEISRSEVQHIVADNSTYIFDFMKTDYSPGKGVKLT